MLNIIKKNSIELIYLILALLLIYTLSYFHHPLLERADTMFHYNRLAILIEALSNGNYPGYIDYSAINGYGYLINTFYPDLTLIPFAIIGLFTSLKTAYLSMLLIISLCTFIFTYSCIKTIFKSKFIGYITALLYTFCLYRLFDVYFRGAIAEYIAFTFLPLILLGIYQISNGDYKKWYIFTIGCFLLLNTHLITVVMVSVGIIVYILINIKQYIEDKKRLKYLLISFLVTVLLSVGFLIPFGEQILSNQFFFSTQPSTDIRYSLLPMNKILEGMLNAVYPSENTSPNPILGATLFFPLFARLFVKCKDSKLIYVDIATIIAFGLVLSSNYYFPWQYIPFKYLQFIQHPTRLLMIASFIFAVAGSYYISLIEMKQIMRKWIPLVLVILTFLYIKVNANNYYEIFKVSGKIENKIEKGLAVGGAEYLPANISSLNDLWNTPRELLYDKENIKITNIDLGDGKAKFEIVNLLKKDSIIVPFTYYKGYKININGKNIDYTQSENGLIKIDVDKQSSVVVSYIGTTIQKISNYFAILFLLVFVIFVSIKTLKFRKK